MRITRRAARRWIFGAAMTGALGFGGAQAIAAPAPAADGAKVCNPEVCNRICRTIPGSIGGFCTPDGGCSCYIGG